MKKFLKYISLTMMLVLIALSTTACVPANVDDAISKMSDAGYVVSEPIITPTEYDAGVIGKIKAQKLDENHTIKDTLIALLFESEDKAKSFYESNGGWNDSVLKKSGYAGKWAYASNSDGAINDFKK